ncbi:hypothetical protein Tco_1396483 [Tanacetum coccineum]
MGGHVLSHGIILGNGFGCIAAAQTHHPHHLVGPVFLLGLLALAIVAACAFRAAAMPSAISCWMTAKVMADVSDVDVFLGGIYIQDDIE